MRLFVAADLSDEQREELMGLVEEAKQAAPFDYIRWLPEENWHATLAFIGDREESGPAEEEVDRHLSHPPSIGGTPGRIQGFPQRDKPRLLAFKLMPSDVTQQLYWKLALAFGIRERNLRLHVTLARFRDLDKESTQGLNAAIKGLSSSKHEWWAFPSVTLYESILKQSGAEYKPLKTWLLGSQ
jgi:RNA 2',3'-cyclic 3'-phosphodiesterase